jgi:hypothetical protein
MVGVLMTSLYRVEVEMACPLVVVRGHWARWLRQNPGLHQLTPSLGGGGGWGAVPESEERGAEGQGGRRLFLVARFDVGEGHMR